MCADPDNTTALGSSQNKLSETLMCGNVGLNCAQYRLLMEFDVMDGFKSDKYGRVMNLVPLFALTSLVTSDASSNFPFA